MFEEFSFSEKQVEKYYQAARRDLKIAEEAEISEVAFRFSYDALLKLAIAVCASRGLRVKARKGHHIELVQKLSSFLSDQDIRMVADEMRSKRNRNLYDGGILISKKEASYYLDWTRKIFQKTEEVLKNDGPNRLI